MSDFRDDDYLSDGSANENEEEENEEEEEEEDEEDYDDDNSYHDDDNDREQYQQSIEKNDEPDEQQTQVFTGKIDVLQQEVDKLKQELENEKRLHEAKIQQIDQLKRDIHNKSNNNLSATRLSTDVMHAFKKFCEYHDIHTHSSFDDLHDEDCKYVLEEATRKILANAMIKAKSANTVPYADETLMNESDVTDRIRNLENELRVALSAADDIKALKSKLLSMIDRARTEKERLVKAQAESNLLRKTIKMLSDHIEKLMSYLKHEASSKIKILEKQRSAEKLVFELEDSMSTLQKKSAAKDRLVLELREGSKILEDQLRLMDDKFLELRSKLDWARESDEKKSRRAAKEAAELRAKIASMRLTSSRGGMMTYTQSGSLPDIFESNRDNARDIGTGGTGSSGVSGGDKEGGEGKRVKKNKKKKEVSIDTIIAKLRRQGHDKEEWTEERARALVKKNPLTK